MSRQSTTTSLYTGQAIDKLYNDICEGLSNIERVEYLDFDRITKYSYERDTKRHWYNWFKEFDGTYQLYLDGEWFLTLTEQDILLFQITDTPIADNTEIFQNIPSIHLKGE